MARKQAKRRKAPVKRQLPTIRPSLVLGPVFVLAAAAAVYELGSILLERPVNSLEISAPMQRVSVMEIEAAIEADLKRGYFTADLDDIRSTVQSLQWIDQAAVARRWPDRIAISVTEQTPAAVWGESGLMNVRGELFVEHDADHLPADLPRLAGPPERSADVARLYLTIREHILPLGLDVRRLALNERGAWELLLSNGVGVRLGRRDVDRRGYSCRAASDESLHGARD